MSWLNRIKEAIVEDTPDKHAPPPAQSPGPGTPTGYLHQPHPQYVPPPGAPGGVPGVYPTAAVLQFDPAKLKELRDKVHPTSGPLVQFLTTLQGLQQFIPDEITRFRAAAQTLQGQGISIDHVMAELNAVLGRIEENRVAAETAKTRKFEQEVTARENRVAEIGKLIEAKQAEITQLMTERDQVFGEAQQSKGKIEEKWAVWEAVRQTLVAEYNDSLRKLKSYFANTTGATK